MVLFVVVQSLSQVWLFVTPWTAACQASLSFTISQSSPKLMSIESVMPSNHLILCRPLLLLPSIFPSIRCPKDCSFSFNITPSNEHPGLISFRMDWLNLLAVQGTLKSLLQHHSSKASNLQCSAFSIVQISHPYMTTGKTVALTRWTFVGKVMSLLFNMMSQFSSVTQSCLTLCDPMNCSMPGFPVHNNFRSLCKPMSIDSVIQYNHLILSRPLLFPHSNFPSIRSFPMSQL